tara:strand:+ start:2223 stop:2513 length:291 start_codon:yes stop_codon:yes gene_type:complete
MDSKKIRIEIIKAGERAVVQLIKVAKSEIIKLDPEDELAADKLKNAAASKKLAVFDAFEIVARIELEQQKIDDADGKKTERKEIKPSGGFAERKSK